MIIFHGEDVAASRAALQAYLDDERKKGLDVLRYDKKAITLTLLKQACEAESLFGTSHVVVGEEWLSGVQAKSKDELVSYLASESLEQVVLWEKKVLTPAVLKRFTKATVKRFDLPKILFSWLDGLGSGGNGTEQGLKTLLESQPVELLFVMVTRRIRQLLILATGGMGALQQIENVADWQVRKLQSQTQKFGASRLMEMYDEMVAFDFKRKTSSNALTLEEALRLWLAVPRRVG